MLEKDGRLCIIRCNKVTVYIVMLGHFLKNWNSGTARVLGASELETLSPGTCLVVIDSEQGFLEGGISESFYFCVWGGNGRVIVQKPQSEDWNSPLFRVEYGDVLSEARYVVYESPYGEADAAATLARAEARLNEMSEEMRSFPGDDFVDECMTGKTMLQLMEVVHPRVGQHWWTPLHICANHVVLHFKADLERQLKESLATEEKKQVAPESKSLFHRLPGIGGIIKTTQEVIKTTKEAIVSTKDDLYRKALRQTYDIVSQIPELPDFVSSHMVEDHAIMLEGNQVVQYKDERVKVASFADFCHTSPATAFGGQASGPAQAAVESRLVTRNRAVMAHFLDCRKPGYRGAFNLLNNNSEHFCRDCRSNKPESLQVRAAVINAAISVFASIADFVPVVNLIPSLFWDYCKPDIVSGEYAKLDEVQFEQL